MTDYYLRPRAFPVVTSDAHNAGMELRDWFAGQALVGLLSGRRQGSMYTADEAAAHAYGIADAMMDRRHETRS